MNKFAQIAELEGLLKTAETNLCWAIREGDSNKMAFYYVERRCLLHELSQVGQ